ncbi:hypothetical protein EV560_106158 [Bosea sp. BK604]|nr:hypothetical protein EV560_106158 [Bosea sp. BK604]
MAKLILNYDRPGDDDAGKTESFDTLIRKVDQMFEELYTLVGGKQASDATLTALAALTTAANKLIYATGVDTFTTTDLSAFIRGLLDDADAATALATLGAFPNTGVVDGSVAATGKVGEILTASATSVSLTSPTPKTITSLALTAGCWDVEWLTYFAPNAATTVSVIEACLSDTDNTLNTTLGEFVASSYPTSFVMGANGTVLQGRRRLNLSAGATKYLVAMSTFATNTMSANGIITAKRVR